MIVSQEAVSRALNNSSFLDRLEDSTGIKFDRDSYAWHDIEEFMVEKLNNIII